MKIHFIIGLLLVSVMLVSQAAALSPSISIILTSQSPASIEPGKNVDIEIEIQNNGYSDGENVIVEIMPNDPFTLLPGEERLKSFSRIGAKDSVKATYTLSTANNAITGKYEVEFRIHEDEVSTTYTTNKITLDVQGSPELIVDSMSISGRAEPDGRINLTVAIKNIGTGTARQVKLGFNSTAELVPILAGGSIYMEDIAPGETADATFSVSIGGSAEHKTYSTYVNAVYLDETNTQVQQSFGIGVPVKGTILLDIIKIEPDYDRGKLKIEIANKGTDDATSLETKLTINREVVGIEYTSTLKATKKTTLSFPLVLKGTGTLEMEYTESGLETGYITKDVHLDYAAPQTNNTTTYLAVFVVVVAALWFGRKKIFKKR